MGVGRGERGELVSVSGRCVRTVPRAEHPGASCVVSRKTIKEHMHPRLEMEYKS